MIIVPTLTPPTVQVYTPPSDSVTAKISSPNCVTTPDLEKDGSVGSEDTQGKRRLFLLLMTVRLDGGARTMVSSVAGVAEGAVSSCS